MKTIQPMRPLQLDLFGYKDSAESKLQVLGAKQEKIRRSFFVRYNLVLKELEELDLELKEIKYLLDEQKQYEEAR